MGVFDTFWGEYKCPTCGNIVRFEEQTKDYYCVLEDFYLGDFMDRGNRNYFYEFESYCPKCHTANDISLAIRRGQFVGIFFKYEADEINILDLDNIEDGYQRRIDYEKMCADKIGKECLSIKLDVKHVGDFIEALRTRWKVEEVYAEIIKQRAMLSMALFIYRVTDGINRRVIEARTGIAGTNLFVKDDNLDETGCIQEDEQGKKCIVRNSTKYIKLS